MARGVAEAFPRWRIIASDPLRESAASVRANARAIPFHRAFDVVGAFDVLERIGNDRAALLEMRGACRPGGGVLLTVPQHRWLWSLADVYAQHHRRYSAASLATLARECGFEILGRSSFHTLNLPLFFLRARIASHGDHTAIPPAPLNWLLERSMEADRMLISAGVRLPLGSSLLLAARRRG